MFSKWTKIKWEERVEGFGFTWTKWRWYLFPWNFAQATISQSLGVSRLIVHWPVLLIYEQLMTHEQWLTSNGIPLWLESAVSTKRVASLYLDDGSTNSSVVILHVLLNTYSNTWLPVVFTFRSTRPQYTNGLRSRVSFFCSDLGIRTKYTTVSCHVITCKISLVISIFWWYGNKTFDVVRAHAKNDRQKLAQTSAGVNVTG